MPNTVSSGNADIIVREIIGSAVNIVTPIKCGILNVKGNRDVS